MVTTQVIRPRQSYRHEAFLWRTDDDFLAGTVPFIAEGVQADEPVMVAVISERIDLLIMALGDRANAVRFVDMAELGRNPANIIPAWQRFLDASCRDGRPVRGIGEPIWAGRRPQEVVECQVHEALLNVAVDPDTPFWLLCPYNTKQLDESVIEEAHRSHPAIVDTDESYRGSPLYGGKLHVDSVFASDLPDFDGQSEQLPFDHKNLKRILSFVATHAHTAGVAANKAAHLAVAVHQVAASSLRRAADGGEIRLWQDGPAFICEVRHPTHLDDPLAGRRTMVPNERDGLWLANQLCDLVQLRSSATGTTARLHHWI
jgi:hypothetical protein